MGNAEYMGSLEKLLELKHSRWSLLWFCCPFSVLPLPSGSTQAQCPELSLPLAAWSNSRPGSWVSSSTLLMPSLMLLAGRRGPSPFLEPCQELETLLPSRLGSSSSSNTSTLSLSGLPLQEEQRGPSPSLELSLSFPSRATHRLRLNGTGLFKLTRLSFCRLKMRSLLLVERRGPPTLLQTFPFPEHLLLLLSTLSRLLSGTMLSSSRLRMKLLLLENEKLWALV